MANVLTAHKFNQVNTKFSDEGMSDRAAAMIEVANVKLIVAQLSATNQQGEVGTLGLPYSPTLWRNP